MKKIVLALIVCWIHLQAFGQTGVYAGPRYSMIQRSWVDSYHSTIGVGFGYATLTEFNDELAFLYDVGVDRLGATFTSFDYAN